jgi:hypothetical protein
MSRNEPVTERPSCFVISGTSFVADTVTDVMFALLPLTLIFVFKDKARWRRAGEPIGDSSESDENDDVRGGLNGVLGLTCSKLFDFKNSFLLADEDFDHVKFVSFGGVWLNGTDGYFGV